MTTKQMKTYSYTGSTRENHGKLIAIGMQFGCVHIRKMSIGDKVAQLANEGNEKAREVCAKNPEFFAVIC